MWLLLCVHAEGFHRRFLLRYHASAFSTNSGFGWHANANANAGSTVLLMHKRRTQLLNRFTDATLPRRHTYKRSHILILANTCHLPLLLATFHFFLPLLATCHFFLPLATVNQLASWRWECSVRHFAQRVLCTQLLPTLVISVTSQGQLVVEILCRPSSYRPCCILNV